jgi:hypothetical protein
MPGKANVQFAFWGFVVMLPLTRMVADREWIALHHPLKATLVIIVLGVPATAARWRTTRLAKQAEAVQFEETEDAIVLSLGLSQDGALPIH